MKTVLIHDSGEYISSEMELPPTDVKGTVQIQKMGASITYARRYQITAMLGMAEKRIPMGSHREGKENLPKPERQEGTAQAYCRKGLHLTIGCAGENKLRKPHLRRKGCRKSESAVKMINTILNDNQEKIPEDTMAFLDRQYEDIRNMPDTQEKYLQYRDFYAFIQQTMKEVKG